MSPMSTSAFHSSSASCPTPARLSMTWSWVPSPSCRLAKQSLPELRGETTPPAPPAEFSGGGVGRQVGVGGADLRQRVGARDFYGIGVATLCRQTLALVPADPELLGEVFLRVPRVGVAHDVPA